MTSDERNAAQRQLLGSMESESTLDTVLQCSAVMPPEIMEKFKVAQTEWQEWMLKRAGELEIPEERIAESKMW